MAIVPKRPMGEGRVGVVELEDVFGALAALDEVATDGEGVGGGDELGHRAVGPPLAEVVEPAAHLL